MARQAALKSNPLGMAKSRLYGMIFGKAEVSHKDIATNLVQLRGYLFLALEKHGLDESTNVFQQVSEATDLEQLWYLRSDVIVAIAQRQGEQAANSELSNINERFLGFLPKGFVTRPSPLGR